MPSCSAQAFLLDSCQACQNITSEMELKWSVLAHGFGGSLDLEENFL